MLRQRSGDDQVPYPSATRSFLAHTPLQTMPFSQPFVVAPNYLTNIGSVRLLKEVHMKMKHRTLSVLGFRGLALASLLAIGACADVDMPEQLDRAEPSDQADTLAQQGRRDLGVGDGSDVITIGDSLMHNMLELFGISGAGGGLVLALARQGVRYRNWATQGVWMTSYSGWGGAILTQFESAISSVPNIKTVIMSGGGNDVIQATNGVAADCKANGLNGPLCSQTLRNISTTLN